MPVSINGNGAITGLVITTSDLADGSVTTAKIAAGAVATVDIADSAVTTAKIADSAITTGKIADGAVATADIADSAVTTAKIANANVTVAKISATGTASSTTFLAGDGSWQAVSSTPTTAQVLTATAGATSGAVGTYAALMYVGSGNVAANGTVAGSNLRFDTSTGYGTGLSGVGYGGFTPTSVGGTAPSGTWRKMGSFAIFNAGGCVNSYGSAIFLRIS